MTDAQERPFGWCSPAEAVLLGLLESLEEGLMEDGGLTDEDRTAMRWQVEVLGYALTEVREAERANRDAERAHGSPLATKTGNSGMNETRTLKPEEDR